MTDSLTKTGIERMIDAEIDERMLKIQRGARRAENIGFYVAIAIAGLYGLAEAVIYFLGSIGKVAVRHDVPFPWITIVLFVGCVIPKILGRTTGGQIWIIIANGVASWFSRGKEKTP